MESDEEASAQHMGIMNVSEYDHIVKCVEIY